MWPCLFRATTQRSAGIFSSTWITKKQLLSFHSRPAVLPGRWDLRVCESARGWLSESEWKRKKKQNKRKTNNQETYSQFLSNPLPGCCRVRDHRGHNKVLFFSCRESQGRKSSTQMKTSLLSVFYFSPKKKAQTQTPFLRVCVILLFVHPLISCSLQMQSVHMGIIKTNNALLLIPHILLKSS